MKIAAPRPFHSLLLCSFLRQYEREGNQRQKTLPQSFLKTIIEAMPRM